MGEQWSPFEKMDPGMKKSFSGEDEKVGAKMDFESKKAGSGLLEILNIVSSESVQLRLLMTAPVKAGHFTTGLASLKELVEGQN